MPEIEKLPGQPGAWRVGDTEFGRHFAPGSRADRFLIWKDQSIIELYADLCSSFQRSRIVELGIYAGGSTALISLLASPVKLVACDISAEPVQALADFIDAKGLGEVVRPHYGVDQGDRDHLARILEDELGGASLDLVIDDASHTWVRTVASFEVLFPHLRPGGLFVIEDWPAQYLMADRIANAQADPTSAQYAQFRAQYEEGVRAGAQPQPPLARLAAEVVLASVRAPDVVAEVRVNRHWLAVTRGPAALDDRTFRLADLYSDHFGWFEEAPYTSWVQRLWERSARPAR